MPLCTNNISKINRPTKKAEWLWYPYILFGKVTILQCDPGCSKTMEALDLRVNAKLLILDPLSAYIDSDINLNQAIDVRSSFRPLYEVTDRTGCTILVISHMNKLQGAASLYRTNGPIDVPGAVRSILSVSKRRHQKDKRAMVHIKCLPPNIGTVSAEVTASRPKTV